jgi:hypothetical protein
LRWHLGTTAKALRASREACSTSGDWSRRLLAEPLQGTRPRTRIATARGKRRAADAMQGPDDPHVGAEVLSAQAAAAEGRAAAPGLEATWWR